MNNNSKLNKVQSLLVASDHYRFWFILSILLLLPGIYLLVYYTGGTKNVYPHIAYLVICFAALTLNTTGGIATALLLGIILGPLMPLDTVKKIPQQLLDWHFRMLMYVIVGGIVGSVFSALKKNAKTIMNLACHNSETNIPNINIFGNPNVLSYDKKPQLVISLLVNNFEKIIDLVGLNVYNRLLFKIYSVLKRSLPIETVIVQVNNNKIWIATPYKDKEKDADKILFILKEGIRIENVDYYIELSFGITDAINQEACYKASAFYKSDEAARYAQQNNLPYMHYRPGIERKMYDVKILGEFLIALEKGEIELVYQPKIDLRTNKPERLEALVRWNHPIRGQLKPKEFIPLLEKTQLIHDLTIWVLSKIITKIREFKSENITMNISMNVSVKHIFDKVYFRLITDIIKENKDISDCIEFEIVERVLMENLEEAINGLQKYKEQGLSFSIDDFGTGNTSLSYLHKLPIDWVKIDRSFTNNLINDNASQRILKAIIDLCHQLNYLIVLEGVEDVGTAELAKKLNVDYVQGFYFSQPITDDKIIEWIKARK